MAQSNANPVTVEIGGSSYTLDVSRLIGGPFSSQGAGWVRAVTNAANSGDLLLGSKGDLLTNDGADSVALPVGTDGQFVIADSGEATGIVWGSTIAALTLTGALVGGASSNITINTNKFTVTASTGNTLVAGTLNATGNFAVATSKFTVAASTGNTVVAGSLGITGATTLTGGIAGAITPSLTIKSRCQTVPVGSVAYGSFGTNTAGVDGTVWWSSVYVPANCTLTGAGFLNGATVAGTNKGIVALWNSTGVLLANSDLAGTTTSGTDAFMELAFTAPYAAVGPATYYVGVQLNSTDKLRTIATLTFVGVVASNGAGVFGTIPAITPGTTFTANKGPIAYLY